MSRNPYDGYPGHRAPPPDLTEEAQFEGLGHREGDERLPQRKDYLNRRWGATTKLELGRNATLVVTGLFDNPLPIGFQLRFSADGVTYSATMPANCGVDVTLIKSFDPKAGPASETFPLDPGDAQPMCQVIARSLTINMRTAETASQPVWVQAVACPLTALDCDAVIPPPATPAAQFSTTTTARYPAVTANTYNIAANARRAYLVIVNQSAANLYVHLGSGVSITPGAEFATIVLPPSAVAGYEVLNYTGEVYFRFDADDASGYALLTAGLYPP